MNAFFSLMLGAWLALLLSGGGKALPVWSAASAAFVFCPLTLRTKVPRAGLLFLWGLWLAACAVFSLEPLNSLWHLSLWLACFLAYFGTAAAAGEKEEGVFISVIVWTGAAFSIFTIIGAFFRIEADKLLLPPNENYAAAFIAAALTGVCARLLSGAGELRGKAADFALAALLAVALWQVKSRGALLGAGAGFVFACLVCGKRRVLAWAALAALAAVLAVPGLLSPLLKRHEGFRYERLNIWKTAAKAAAQKPVFGWGQGCFERAYLRNNFPAWNSFSYYNYYTGSAHSQLLQQAAETGLPGALFFAVFFLPAFWRPSKERLRPVAMLLCLFCMALVDVIMALPLISVTMFMLAALSYRGGNAEPVSRGPFAAAALVVCGGLLAGAFAAEKKAAAREGVPGAMSALAVLYPQDDAIYAALSAQAQSPFSAAELLERASELNPRNAVYRLRLAALLRQNGATSEAQEQLRICLESEPNAAPAALLLGVLKLSSGDAEGAGEFLLRARSLRGRYAGYAPKSGYEAELLAYDPELDSKLERALASARAKVRKLVR